MNVAVTFGGLYLGTVLAFDDDVRQRPDHHAGLLVVSSERHLAEELRRSLPAMSVLVEETLRGISTHKLDSGFDPIDIPLAAPAPSRKARRALEALTRRRR
jgi:hypothetical protein